MNKYIEEVILHPLTYFNSRAGPRRPGGGGGGRRPREVPVLLVHTAGAAMDAGAGKGPGEAKGRGALSVSKSSIGIPLFDRDETEVTKASKYLVGV
jgi:hypothetical protein